MKEIIKELSGWLLYIVLIIALTWTVVTFVGQRTEVSGSSMETTLSDKDQLIVDKMTYRFRDPKRYDIVVFPYQYQDNTYYIKPTSDALLSLQREKSCMMRLWRKRLQRQ